MENKKFYYLGARVPSEFIVVPEIHIHVYALTACTKAGLSSSAICICCRSAYISSYGSRCSRWTVYTGLAAVDRISD